MAQIEISERQLTSNNGQQTTIKLQQFLLQLTTIRHLIQQHPDYRCRVLHNSRIHSNPSHCTDDHLLEAANCNETIIITVARNKLHSFNRELRLLWPELDADKEHPASQPDTNRNSFPSSPCVT